MSFPTVRRLLSCHACGNSTVVSHDFAYPVSDINERGNHCPICQSPLVEVVESQITYRNVAGLSITSLYHTTATIGTDWHEEESRSQLPKGCGDFTTDDILHTLVTFESGLPSEEAQKFVVSCATNSNACSTEPGRGVEDTDAGADGLRPHSVSIEHNKDNAGEAKGDGVVEDLAEATLPCPICLVDILESSECIVKLFCNHYYHQACLREWVKRKNYCCPMCKKPLIVE